MNMKNYLRVVLITLGIFTATPHQISAAEVLVIEGDVIRGNEEQPMVTHILPWTDRSLVWPSPVIELKSIEDALLSPIEPTQIRNEVEFIQEINRNKKQLTSVE